MLRPPSEAVYIICLLLAGGVSTARADDRHTTLSREPAITRETLRTASQHQVVLTDPLGRRVEAPREIVRRGLPIVLRPAATSRGLSPSSTSERVVSIGNLRASALTSGPRAAPAAKLYAELLRELTVARPNSERWRLVAIDEAAPVYVRQIETSEYAQLSRRRGNADSRQTDTNQCNPHSVARWDDDEVAAVDRLIAESISQRYVGSCVAIDESGRETEWFVGPEAAFNAVSQQARETPMLSVLADATPRRALPSDRLVAFPVAPSDRVTQNAPSPLAPRNGSVRPDVIDPVAIGRQYGDKAERLARRVLICDGANRKLFLDEIDDDTAALLQLLPRVETTRLLRAELLYRRGRAIGYRELPGVRPTLASFSQDENDAAFDATFRALDAIVDTESADYYLLRIRKLRRQGRFLEALELLLAKSSLGQWKLTDKKRRDLCEELGWVSLQRLLSLHMIAAYELPPGRTVDQRRASPR